MRRSLFPVALLALAAPVLAQTTIKPADQQKAQAYYQQGWKALASESFEQAVAAFSEATALDPQLKLGFYGLGTAHMGLKHFPEAVKAYEHARDLYAEKNIFANKGDVDQLLEEEQRQLQVALQQFGATTSSMTSSPRILDLQAQYRQMQRKRDMVRDVDLRDPVAAFVHLALGSAYLRSNRLAAAEPEYKAAVADDPKMGEAWNNLAVVYLETNRLDDADRAVKAAEKAGFHVPPGLKDDIKTRKAGK
jgi:tetratricopeptide (TPR) repeat protein